MFACKIARSSMMSIKFNCVTAKETAVILTFLTPTPFICQQNRRGKHWNPKFRKERAAKVLKFELPDYDQKRRDKDLTIEEVKQKMKKDGIQPTRPWHERPMNLSCLGAVVDAYVPPEGDAKASIVSTPGMKQTYDTIGKKGKSYLALRKIRNIDYEFDIPTVAEHLKTVYIKAQTALANHDEDTLHTLVTEKAFPEMTENIKSKIVKWSFHKTFDSPRIVHIRCQDMMEKENLFAQITLRLHSQQTLAIYDRFGRLMFGSEDILKDSIEYIVFEKHISNPNGSWRIHGKIIPDWLPPKDPIQRTYFVPIDIADPEKTTESLVLSESSSNSVESAKL